MSCRLEGGGCSPSRPCFSCNIVARLQIGARPQDGAASERGSSDHGTTLLAVAARDSDFPVFHWGKLEAGLRRVRAERHLHTVAVAGWGTSVPRSSGFATVLGRHASQREVVPPADRVQARLASPERPPRALRAPSGRSWTLPPGYWAFRVSIRAPRSCARTRVELEWIMSALLARPFLPQLKGR